MRGKSKSNELNSFLLLSEESVSVESPSEFESSLVPELSEAEDCYLRQAKAVDKVPPGVRPVRLHDNGEP